MQKIITTTLYLLTIFIPLTFTVINSELFEFPKFILLISGSLTITLAATFDIIYNKKQITWNNFTNSRVSQAVLIVLATQLIATLFSINPFTSFWGYYSRFHQGLLTTICYTIIYFAAIFYLDTKSVQKIIKISIGTAFVVSLYAILQRFGIDRSLWIQDVVNRPFSTLGQPNWLAAYLLPNIFFVLYFGMTNKAKNSTLYSIFVFSILTAALLLTKSRSGTLAYAVSYFTYWLLIIRQFSWPRIKAAFFRFSLCGLLVITTVGTPYSPSLLSLKSNITNLTSAPTLQGTQLENGGTESGDIRKIVWTGALELIKQNPLVGTGPETFAYTYYWTRPVAHNHTSEWDFLYNKAHNEYLNIAATSGIVGLLAYLYLHYTLARVSLTTIPKTKKIRQEQDDYLRHLYPVIGAVVVAFAVTNFFGFSVIPVYLLLTTTAALPMAIKNTTSFQSNSFDIRFAILLVLLLIYPSRLFFADYNYALGKAQLDLGQAALALPNLQSASRIRPSEPLYHAALAESYVLLDQPEAAIRHAELTRQHNPHHLNYYKSRAKVYLTLAAGDSSYYAQAANELISARRLAPTDPKLAYNLALIYTRLGDNEQAAEQLRDSITLKSDYESPYYALTLLYEQTNQKDLIPELLNNAKNNLATYSAQLRDKIEQY